jgi:hypothetical protein
LALAALVLLLVLQCFLWYGIRHEALFTLPKFASDIIREKISESGVACNFRALRVRLGGYLEADDLEIAPVGGAAPNFTIKRAAVAFDLLELLRAGKLVPKRIFAEGGVFYCPAPVAPDGKRQAVLRDIRAVLFKENADWVRVETLQARYGNMPIVIHGQFIPPAPAATPGVLTAAEWGAINNIAGRMLAIRARLEALGDLSLEVKGSGDNTGSILFDLTARGETLRLPLPGKAVARNARLEGTVRFDGTDFRVERDPEISVRGALWEADGGKASPFAPPGFSVATGPMRLSARFNPGWHLGAETQLPARIRLVATDVTTGDVALDFLRGSVRLGNFPPQIGLSLVLVSDGDSATLRGDVNWETHAANLAYSVRLTPSRYLTHPKVTTLLPAQLKSLNVHQNLWLRGTAGFAPNLKSGRADFDFSTGAVSFEGFNVLGADGHVALTPDGIELSGAEAFAASYWGAGGFRTGFAPNAEFRVLLAGSFDPHLLNPFIGPGWTEIWSQIGLRQTTLPYGGVDVHGHWGTPTEHIYVGAGGKNVSFRGVEFEHAELRVGELPGVIALFDMKVAKGGNRAGGTLQIHDKEAPRKHHESIRLAFTGSLEKEDIVKLVGGSLPKILTPLHTNSPVAADVTAYIHGERSPTPKREQVLVNIRLPEKFEAWGQSLKNFRGTAAYDTGLLCVDIGEAEYSGGKIGGAVAPWASQRKSAHCVWVDTRQENPLLTLDLELLGAQRSLFLENLQRLGGQTATGQTATGTETLAKPETEAGTGTGTVTTTGAVAAAGTQTGAVGANAAAAPAPLPANATEKKPAVDNSRLDVSFLGNITPPDFATLAGVGKVALKDSSIPQLYVFGGLSRVLEKVKIGFTNYKLETAESDFVMRKCVLYFPNIKVTGVDAQIECKGNFDILADKLNFVAVLDSKVGESVPLVGLASKVFNKWTNLAMVRVTGSLKDPQWSIDPSPTGLFRDVLKSEKIGTPPPE